MNRIDEILILVGYSVNIFTFLTCQTFKLLLMLIWCIRLHQVQHPVKHINLLARTERYRGSLSYLVNWQVLMCTHSILN